MTTPQGPADPSEPAPSVEPAPSEEPAPSAADQSAEVERLRAEVERLRRQSIATQAVPVAAGPRRARGTWVRWTASGVLVVFAALFAIGAVAARYVRGELLDTDRYVSTVGPLGSDPTIQKAVADKVTTALVDKLDVQSFTQQALNELSGDTRIPEQIQSLAPVIANQANSFIGNTVDRFVQSDAFANLWVQANQAAHKNVVAVLTGSKDATLSANGDDQVTVDLGPIVAAAQQRLVDRGLSFASKIPPVDASIVVFTSPDIHKAQVWVRAFNRAATWLPLVALVLAAAAVWVAPRGARRRALVVVAGAVALAMVVLGLGITVGRTVYIGAVPTRVLPHDAAGIIFDTVVQPLRTTLRLVLVTALVVAVVAFLVGASSAAVGVRKGFMWTVGRASGGHAGDVAREPRAYESWVARYRVALTVVIVAVAGIVLVFWHYPTGAVAFWVALIAVVLAVAVQVVAAPARAAQRAALERGDPAAVGAEPPSPGAGAAPRA
jgi:hypothetical protein